MTSHRALHNLVRPNIMWIKVIEKSRCYSATSDNKPSDWDAARPFKDCPKINPFEMIPGFFPGGKFYKKDMNEILNLVRKEKGDLIYTPPFPRKTGLAISFNPNDFEKIFRTEGVWPERNAFELLKYHRHVHRKDFFGEHSGLLTTQDKNWNYIRSAVNPILIHPRNVKAYIPIVSKTNEDFIERIKQIRDPLSLEVPSTFQIEINRWTLESLATVALDTRLNLLKNPTPASNQFFQNLLEFFELTIELESKPSLWRYLPNRKLKKAMAILDEIVSFTEKHVNEALKYLNTTRIEKPNHEKSVLEKLLKVDKHLAVIMASDMLFAGVDTTTTTFTGLLLCLGKNPDKQEKLREEILQILPEKNTQLTEEHMRNLPYLRACLKESLRLYPVVAATLRQTKVDLVLNGYRVPKGTGVAMASADLLRDAEQFGEPNKFVPERWLREFNATSDHSCPHVEISMNAHKSAHKFVYLPFGFGPRSCIGRRIAEMQIEVGIAHLIRNFKVEYNHSIENAFKFTHIFVPAIPLKFKFIDI